MDIIDLRAKKFQAEEQKRVETEQDFIRRRFAAVSKFERVASRLPEPVIMQAHSAVSGAGFFVKQFFITIAGLAMLFLVANAGSLQPSAAPASTMHSLLEITSRTDSPDNFNRYNYSLEGLGVILGTPTSTATQIATTSATIASSINGVYTRLAVPPFGGGATATTTYSCPSGTCTDLNLNQLYTFTSFTVSSGATLAPSTAAPGGLYVLVSGTCTIAGTIDVSAKGNSGGAANPGLGGTGAGDAAGAGGASATVGTSANGGSGGGGGGGNTAAGGGGGGSGGGGGGGGSATAGGATTGGAGGGGGSSASVGGGGGGGGVGLVEFSILSGAGGGGGGSNNGSSYFGGGAGGAGSAGSVGAGGGQAKPESNITFVYVTLNPFRHMGLWGSFGAGGGGGNGSSAGAGGKGGGVVYLECNTLNFTGTINANGANGTVATNGTAGGGAGGTGIGQAGSSGTSGAAVGTGGGGGGGGGGAVAVLYRRLVANTGSVTVNGGNGGNGLATGSGGGGGASGFYVVTTIFKDN